MIKGFLSVFAGFFWALFFSFPRGIYFEHVFQLSSAIMLTIIVLILDYKESLQIYNILKKLEGLK